MSNKSHRIILPYQKNWPEKFIKEKELLMEVFGHKASAIEHIGSTSIPGLSSKPIIDIAVIIESVKEANNFIDLVSKVGYEFNRENHIEVGERHFFTKGDPIEYHLSIAYADQGGFWSRQIAFRDYLRNNSDLRDEYDNLKKKLLNEDPTGYDIYIKSKTDFVYKVLDLAGWNLKKTKTFFKQKKF